MCAQIFLSVVIDPLLDWAELEWAQLSDKEKAELAEQSDDERTPLLFLPFPFTTETIEQPPYRGSDPEWKEFLAVNKSPELQERMKCKTPSTSSSRTTANKTQHNLPTRFDEILNSTQLTTASSAAKPSPSRSTGSTSSTHHGHLPCTTSLD